MLRVADGPTAVLGCRSALTAYLRAREGIDVVAFEEHAPSIDAAKIFIERAAKPRGSLQLSTLEELSSTTGPSSAFRVVALLDTLERTWNPVGVIGEARRLLAADGLLVVRARARASACEDRGEALHPFAAHELLQIVRHVGGFTPLTAPASDGMGRWTLVARRTGSAAHVVHFGAPKIDGAPQSP